MTWKINKHTLILLDLTKKCFLFCTILTRLLTANLQEEIEHYGIDWDGPVAEQSELDQSVDVPELPNIISYQSEQELRQLINPLQESDCYGLNIYMETLQFVERTLQ